MLSYVRLVLDFTRIKGLTTFLNYVVILNSLAFCGRFVYCWEEICLLKEMEIA
jgi:hypothetical protein